MSNVKWISVKEQLPTEDGDYLVTDCQACMVGHFFTHINQWRFFAISNWDHNDVFYWMPLPKMPNQ